MKPTAERLCFLFIYDPESGLLTRRVKTATWTKVGEIAGSVDAYGYWCVCVDGKTYKNHCVIWCMQTGEWPERDVDHEDTDPGNNRWRNLRLATDYQNQANVALRIDNSSGFKGISRRPSGNWVARMQINGKSVTLGTRKTKEEAATLYAEAAAEHHGQFKRLNAAPSRNAARTARKSAESISATS